MSECRSSQNERNGNISAFFSQIPVDVFSQNVFASAVADAVCKGKSKSEIANTMQFLQLLCCLMKTYMF